jgi:hypothetical protein
MKRSRTENQEALAGIVAAIVGLVIVSDAPTDLRPIAILVLIVVYVLGFLVLGYLRARRGGSRQ